jgi:hypothetical protein
MTGPTTSQTTRTAPSAISGSPDPVIPPLMTLLDQQRINWVLAYPAGSV